MHEGDIEQVAYQAMEDEQLLRELLEKLLAKEDDIRYPSFQALLVISEKRPELLYPHWDFFVELLTSDNAFRGLIAVRLIAYLTQVDVDHKFEQLFETCYGLLSDSAIVAGHLASNSGKIARAKPELEPQITKRLLTIDSTNHKHKDLIKSGAIEAFDDYYEVATNKQEIMEFVQEQLKSTSPKTRKKAKEFLKNWQ